MYRGGWKYNWTFFSVYMMTVNDFIKSQNSIQCLTNFEEIIVIFGVRWNEPFEMWKRAVWKYWTVWTKNTIKLCTLNVEGKSSQLRVKLTHYKTWFVQFFVSFIRCAEWNTCYHSHLTSFELRPYLEEEKDPTPSFLESRFYPPPGDAGEDEVEGQGYQDDKTAVPVALVAQLEKNVQKLQMRPC